MKYRVIAAMLLAASIAMAGCGNQSAAPKEEAQTETAQEAPAEENSETPEAADAAGENAETSNADAAKDEAAESSDAAANDATAAEAKYESPDGWYVMYNDSLIDAEVSDGIASFNYTGESTGLNEISFNYFMNRMPDEVLYDAIATDEGMPEHERSEGYFGSSGTWAMRVKLTPEEGSDDEQEFIAMEHNGGTLLIQIDSHKEADEENGMKISDTLAYILDSFTFTEHEKETYSAYVPGKYVAEVTDEIGGQEVTAEYYVELKEDHSGVIHMQDDVPVIWYMREGILLNADTGEQIYEYDVEGDNLYLIDMADDEAGITIEFERQQ